MHEFNQGEFLLSLPQEVVSSDEEWANEYEDDASIVVGDHLVTFPPADDLSVDWRQGAIIVSTWGRRWRQGSYTS